jgi:mannosylglycerate hydrolase MGH1-like protein
MQKYLELLNQAKEILQGNTITVTVNGKHYERSIPSRDFYVHQWLWDSAGVAMGLVHFHEEAAFNELLSLIAGQWNNGLIPHIIYDPGQSKYYPPAEQWHTRGFTRDGIQTSGITDPHSLPLLLNISASMLPMNRRDKILSMRYSRPSWHTILT